QFGIRINLKYEVYIHWVHMLYVCRNLEKKENPHFYYLSHGCICFPGKRSVEGIIQWMKRRAGPGTSNLDSVDSAAKFISTHNISVVGFFSVGLISESAHVFKEVSFDLTDVEFGVTVIPEVFQKYEVKSDSVVLFKKFDDGREDYVWSEEDKLDKHNLSSFIKENSLELIIPFNPEMLFVLIDVTQALSHVLNYFGVSESDAPTARIIHMETQKKFSIPSGALTADSLWLLCQEVVDGIAMPYYRTEEIPEDWDKEPVKVLVGKNFKSVALDPAKNVFIEFYAPWCGHCKELAPIWDQLGEKYADHENIIIAKMDATANEVESLVISGFPTIKYYPAEGKEVVDYTGNRDLETFSKFLDSGGVLPQEESGDDDDYDDGEESSDAKEEDSTGDQSKVSWGRSSCHISITALHSAEALRFNCKYPNSSLTSFFWCQHYVLGHVTYKKTMMQCITQTDFGAIQRRALVRSP
uniref:protein disulfide-isomerase n=1 Tax=Xiphophorus couchianus TaxID=32473 RepID=A0A3B5LBV0_9TELE